MIDSSVAGLKPDPLSAAEIYERDFVPALFGAWGPAVCTLADVGPGHHVLDVATGTGVLARAASARVGPQGRVEGIDPNPEMLAVARKTSTDVRWVDGRAESLPYSDQAFDRVVSQFGMMFFDSPVEGLREAARVLREKGRLAFAVWGPLDWSPGYSVLVELLHRRFGPVVAESFRAPFTLGSLPQLEHLASQAGLRNATVERRDGLVRFASIRALVATERACAWTLGGILDEAQFDDLTVAAETSLQPFTDAKGTLTFDLPALVLMADRP